MRDLGLQSHHVVPFGDFRHPELFHSETVHSRRLSGVCGCGLRPAGRGHPHHRASAGRARSDSSRAKSAAAGDARRLEGELTLFVTGEQIVLRPGHAALARRDVPHAYRVESEEVRWLVITTPAGFDSLVRAVAEPAPVEILGAPGALPA